MMRHKRIFIECENGHTFQTTAGRQAAGYACPMCRSNKIIEREKIEVEGEGFSSLKEVAVFSIFRRTAEQPLYRIEKRPKLRSKQGEYSVIGMDGQILKRGHELKTVLRVFDKKRIRVV